MEKRKAVFSNKVLLIVAAVALTMAAAVGFTYAWFTTSVNMGNTSVNMGRLQVEATFPTEDEAVVYEPGLEVEKSGSLKNTGSMASFVKVTIEPTVIKRSDENGNPTTPSAPITDDPNVLQIFDDSLLGYKMEGEEGADSFYWYKDGEGNYYVLMDGNAAPDVNYTVAFNGSGMGNDYQGAEIIISGNWKATQALEQAIVDEFGVDFDSLEFIANDLGASPVGRSARVAMTAEQAEAKAAAIVKQQ
ncbi:hypothetical protein M2454_001133 [Aequitasia blattaphilus]|uniref:SipW-cognate class signal peptide n=1 Tax=Aequitasia blattaphilus TaxID=2949332 RepID=A0ABT1E6E1_9FIRM|nr:hypothetical protein [Aequitasia blattaphilus]MCP1101397.1 hypothetical protein [Aequitasia blattaphilus]MCR8614037.1 hypothetical protein [Aequitasia blattaphilus]